MKLKKLLIIPMLLLTVILVVAATSCSLLHEHSFSEWESVTEPTCTAFGLQKRVCECGAVEYDTVDALAHTEVKDAGYSATCTAQGKTDGIHCDTCGTIIEAQTEIPMQSHGFSEWETVAQTTCTAFGLQRRVCACGYVEYNTEDAFVHTPVIDAGTEATCTAPGKTEGSHCADCGAVIVLQTEIPILSHSFSEWETVSEPTCTSIGLQKRACKCGQAEYNTISALSHTVVTNAAVSATCTTQGKTEGSYCSACGVIISVQSDIAPTGHNFDEVTVLKEALCNQDGMKRYSCSNANCECYYDESYSLPSLDTAELFAVAEQYTGRLWTFGRLGELIHESSAFVISADGKIAACSYVIDNAYSAIFILGDTYYDVTEVLAYNNASYLAVLKIDATDLPYAKIAESELVNGETVYSAGTPTGLPISISGGVVSNTDRELNSLGFIQHDADLTGGYVGGPLLNRLGEVVGINVFYFGDQTEYVHMATKVSELEALDYSTPIPMEEYGVLTYTPVEQLDDWVNNFANAASNELIAYAVQGDNFYYSLGYDTVYGYSFVDGYWVKEGNYQLYVRIILNNSSGVYEYHAIFTDGKVQNETIGFIDAATFTAETVLEYDTYYGRYWTEAELMALYSTAAYDSLEFFSYCLDTYFDTLTLETFGFTSLTYDRDEDALAKLQNFVKSCGMYEELTGSYVLSGSSQMGNDTMQFNIAHHLETGDTVVNVHYYLANGDIYSAYLTLNPTENGNRFDFMYSSNGEDGYKINNTAWGYLDAATLTNQTKLTCYEFVGMNEYEDGLLMDYSMFLDYIIGLINYSVMPSVDPALTAADLGFYFYFG